MVREEEYYCVLETEGGQRYGDPSQDHIFDMISGLEWPDETFFTIEGVNSDWYVVVTLLEEGGFEVEYKNPARREHRIESEDSPSNISTDVIVWISGAKNRAQGGR